MSRIADLGPKLSNIPTLIEEYEKAFADISQHLTLKGKTLQFALKEQSTWPIYYEARRVELKSLVKFLDAQVQRIRGSLTRRLIEANSRDLGERIIAKYVDADPEYMRMYELYLEVEELYEKYSATRDVFDKRGFALRDLTLALQHQLQDTAL